ncbi:MAG: DUF3048 domain-containing protein [Lachnospiraceae bacterium]|nr:DUF3048 domain-containing protein [Candidatus Colinaster equi]
MKKKLLLALVCMTATLALVACGKDDDKDGAEPVTMEVETIGGESEAATATEEEAVAEKEPAPAGMYYSELTGIAIDEALEKQKPIAAMVDNESTALPHFGLNDADVIYEMMNSTANDRITRLMVVYKDWGNIEQLGSIRSIRPTNIMVAGEYNAVMCHDGGPFYIDEYFTHDYAQHFSGIFSRVNNGKAREFTEYICKGDLDKAFKNSSYSTEYDEYYEGPHFTFSTESVPVKLDGAKDVKKVDLSAAFKHNSSMLKYDDAKQEYVYCEYGKEHVDGKTNEPLSFKNAILQKCSFNELDKNGYLVYNVIGEGTGYYLTNGQMIEIKWEKTSENGITHFMTTDGKELEMNAGMTYIGIVPADYWDGVVFE